MSNYKNKVLELVNQRPGIRSVQISDLIDLDMDIVESILSQAVREEVIQMDVVLGLNGLPTKTYSRTGLAPQGMDKVEVEITVKHEMQQPASTAPAVAAPTAPVSARAAVVNGRSKSSIAMDYLMLNGPTDRTTLMGIMGLVKKYSIEQYLKPQIKSGKIVRIDDVYCIPNRPAVAAIAQDIPTAAVPANNVEPEAAADPVHSPAHYTSGGMQVIEILRAKLSPEEFRGFLKGNVIKYMMRAEHKGGAQDYKKGSVYATWLAESVTAQAA